MSEVDIKFCFRTCLCTRYRSANAVIMHGVPSYLSRTQCTPIYQFCFTQTVFTPNRANVLKEEYSRHTICLVIKPNQSDAIFRLKKWVWFFSEFSHKIQCIQPKSAQRVCVSGFRGISLLLTPAGPKNRPPGDKVKTTIVWLLSDYLHWLFFKILVRLFT